MTTIVYFSVGGFTGPVSPSFEFVIMVFSSIPGTWTDMVRLQRKKVLAVLAISLVVVE
jgi:hypothetical protein